MTSFPPKEEFLLLKTFRSEAAKNRRLTGWLKGMEDRGLSREFETLEGVKRYILNWSYLEEINSTRKNFTRKQDIESSRIVHQSVINRLYGESNKNEIKWQDKGGDVTNAQDYFFLTSPLINLPRKDITVLDYGAGYGRAINFLKELGCTRYIATDAIENSYVSQYVYLKTFCDIYDWNFNEVLINDPYLKNLNSKSNFPQINHLPTWQLNKLIDISVDLVLFNQSLTEFSKYPASYALSQVNRLVKEGGFIYIRDNDFVSSEHGLDEDAFFRRRNIIKIYDSPFKQNEDIHGSIRIYRKVSRQLTPTMYVGRLCTRNKIEMFFASICIKNKSTGLSIPFTLKMIPIWVVYSCYLFIRLLFSKCFKFILKKS